MSEGTLDSAATEQVISQPTATDGDPAVVIAGLREERDALKAKLAGSVPMVLQYQGSIDGPPCPPEQLYTNACRNDGVTVASWSPVWLDHVATNAAKYDFLANSVMNDFKKYEYHPAIVAGSGPSLKRNAHHLLNKPKEIPLVSCLHNFGYFEDLGIDVDSYVNLDAGEITVSEMYQGGSKPEQWYWDRSADKTLVTSVCGNPKLIDKWKGRILWFNAMVPNKEYIDAYNKITKFILAYNVGGNTLGACLYHARAILGCMPIAFIGADFAFDYTRKFHPFDSPYDTKFAGVQACTDVWGNRVYAWPSYINFKNIFEYFALGGHLGKPPILVNCTEGGILGAYNEGNMRQITQMLLEDFLHMYCCHSEMENIAKDTNQIRFIY